MCGVTMERSLIGPHLNRLCLNMFESYVEHYIGLSDVELRKFQK